MNKTYCLLSFLFIGASLYTMFTCENCPPFVEFKKSLSKEQLILYKSISKERLNVSLQGLGLGTVLACVYLFLIQKSTNIIKNSCAITAIILLTQYLYYMLYPKMSLLPYLQTNEQVNEWYKVYKFMQYRYHAGMLLGVIGYFLLAYVLC